MFNPKQILFEKGTRDTEIGKRIIETFKGTEGITFLDVASNQIKGTFEGTTMPETYQNGKKTLVVSKKRAGSFQTCKPSADYMLPLVSGCMGQCEYCYLHTQLGDKPFVRVNVNVDDILAKAKDYIDKKPGEVTSFEGSATSDPVCVEPFTHSLTKAIEFFAKEPNGRFRFVTKYNDVDSFLNIDHKGKTEIRFSINTPYIKKQFEHFTASIDSRIEAAAKVAAAGYPIGFLVAPVFIYENWKEEYLNLLEHLKETLPDTLVRPLTFEVITHRYTTRAKNLITDIFPETTLPMNEEERTYRHGQFGYGKYVYTKEEIREVKEFFKEQIPLLFPDSELLYVV